MTGRPPVLRVWWLYVTVALEAAVLLGWLGLDRRPVVLHDFRVYHQMAVNLLEHGAVSMSDAPPLTPTLFRPPGFPAFVGLLYAVFPRNLTTVAIGHFVLLALMGHLLHRLTELRFGPVAATAAGLIGVTYPPFVFMAPIYAAHVVTLAMIAATFLALEHLLRGQDPPRAWQWCALGFFVGLATLVRPAFQALPFALGAAILVLHRSWPTKRRAVAAAGLCAGLLLCLVPWCVRNNRVSRGESGTRVMVGGWALWHSALQYTGEISYKTVKPEWDRLVADFNAVSADAAAKIPGDPLTDPTLQPRRELQVERTFTQGSREQIAKVRLADLPGNLLRRLAYLWSTSDVSPWQTGTFHRFQQVLHVVVMVLIVAGLIHERDRLLQQWPLWLMVLYQTGLHLVYHVEARFTLEARLLLLPYAGIAIAHALRRIRGPQVALDPPAGPAPMAPRSA